VTEILTRDFLLGWCVSAATLVIEHWLCQPPKIPYWPRYVLGVVALLVGGWCYEWTSGGQANATVFAGLSTAGFLIFAFYGLEVRILAALKAAREVGILEGRAIEAARRAWQARRSRIGDD
jgi:hypothetical protein